MTGNGKLVLAIPSKGRLMDQCNAALAKAGIVVERNGPARGYKGEIAGMPDVEVNFVSSRDRAAPQDGRGASRHHRRGPDPRDDCRRRRARAVHRRLGFGRADVVVAVPACWLDVRRMADLEEMALAYRGCMGAACGWRPST